MCLFVLVLYIKRRRRGRLSARRAATNWVRRCARSSDAWADVASTTSSVDVVAPVADDHRHRHASSTVLSLTNHRHFDVANRFRRLYIRLQNALVRSDADGRLAAVACRVESEEKISTVKSLKENRWPCKSGEGSPLETRSPLAGEICEVHEFKAFIGKVKSC